MVKTLKRDSSISRYNIPLLAAVRGKQDTPIPFSNITGINEIKLFPSVFKVLSSGPRISFFQNNLPKTPQSGSKFISHYNNDSSFQ